MQAPGRTGRRLRYLGPSDGGAARDQFLGHAVFERRRPAFVDDLSQTLIGPMFVVAKMLVRLRMRPDLAAYLAEERSPVKSLS